MLNKIQIIGRIGADVETRRLESGKSVSKFPVATSETWKNQNGQKQEETQWHSVVAWGKTAEVAEKWLKKGMLVYVEGKMTYRTYEGNDGQKKYFSEIVASTFKMLGGKDEAKEPAAADVGAGDDPSGDLPF